MKRPLLILLFMILSFQSWGANSPPVFDRSEQEQRYQTLITELRCVQCQNQSVADSDAGIAQDIRVLVQTKILEGQTDQQIIDFLVERYGDFVLYNPPFKPITYLLWLLPPLLLIFALWILKRAIGQNTTPQLSEAEQLKIKQILEKDH